MPKLTITADEDVLRWVRAKAAEEHPSVARLVGNLLKEKMRTTRDYAAARRHHFALIRLCGSPESVRSETSFMTAPVFVDTSGPSTSRRRSIRRAEDTCLVHDLEERPSHAGCALRRT
jgi:hypothetical protein